MTDMYKNQIRHGIAMFSQEDAFVNGSFRITSPSEAH